MRITLYRVTFNMAHRNAGRKLVSCLCTLQQRHPCAENGATVPRNNTRAAYLAMPPHADHWPRGRCASAKYHRSAGGVRPAQTEIIHVRVEAHETAHEAVEAKCGAVACKQSFHGAVVVQHIRAQVMLTGVVGGRHQTAHRSHLSSHTTVGLEAQQSNQRGHRRGGGRLQRCQQVCQGLATGGGSPSRHSCDLTASKPAARPRSAMRNSQKTIKVGKKQSCFDRR